MNSIQVVQRMVESLDALNIPMTKSASFVERGTAQTFVENDPTSICQLVPGQFGQLRQTLGPQFNLDPQTRFEAVTGTYKNVVRVIDSDFEIELFRLSNDPHDQVRFQRRIQNSSLGFLMWVPTVEDVVITKLRWAVGAGRGKDRDDVKEVIGVQRGQLDWNYVHHWAAEHGTRTCLDEIIRSIPAGILLDEGGSEANR